MQCTDESSTEQVITHVFYKSNTALYALDQSDGPLYVFDQSNVAFYVRCSPLDEGHLEYSLCCVDFI